MERNIYAIIQDWHELLKNGTITEDEFNQIVAIFYFFRGQKNNDTQAECIEPNPEGSNLEQNEIQSRKAG